MRRYTKDTPIDVDKYEDRLRYRGYIYVDRDSFMSSYEYQCAQRDTRYNLCMNVLQANSGNRFVTLDSANVIEYLIDYEGCPEYKFRKKNVQSESLDMTKVLEPLYADGYAREFLDHYMAFKSLKSKCATMYSLLGKLYEVVGTATDGSQLYKLKFNVSQQRNMRFYYKDYSILSIPKSYSSGITVPDGYVLAWGDFAQSDLRIAYNLLLKNDEDRAIMDACEDKYEGIARVIAKTYNEEFDVEAFKAERDLYKVYILKTIYGTVRGASKSDDAFVQRLNGYLNECPKYVEYRKRIEKRCSLGLPLQVTGYFGFSQNIRVEPYNIKNTINDALNAPVQTGSSQIVILTTNGILDKFYELGYTPEDISIYLNRHDEPVFIMKQEVLKDAWVFKDFEDIYVDDWTPLKLTFEYGYRYNVPDKYITTLANRSYENNIDKITIVDTKAPVEHHEYYPVSDTLELGMGIGYVEDKTIVSFFNVQKNAADYLLINSTEDDVVLETILQKLISIEDKLAYDDITGVLIRSKYFSKELFYSKVYYKIINKEDPVSSGAQILAYIMCEKYAKKYNITSYVPRVKMEDYRQFAAGIGELGIVI